MCYSYSSAGGQTMTEKEKAAIMMKVCNLWDAGKDVEAHALQATIPLQPWLAKVLKDKVGADFLIKAGYNLSEAEAEFGQNWLTH
jgi:hypothetical protein